MFYQTFYKHEKCEKKNLLHNDFAEFRQLLVETLILLSMVVENRVVPLLDDVIQVAKIVKEANKIFLKDQVSINIGQTNGIL